jgi:hypothetical protein
MALTSFAFPSRSPSLFPFPFSFISPSSALPSFFSFSLHHLPTLPPPPHHPHFVPSPSPIVYAPLVFPRSGSTSPSSSNRTAGQCATYSDHVQPTCPTRPCSSSKYHTGAERAVYRSRNSLIQHHPYRSAIRERTELLSTFLYPRQGLRGWLLWYGLALRLAWGATPQ